jgi:hypothetical protein
MNVAAFGSEGQSVMAHHSGGVSAAEGYGELRRVL